MLERHLLRDPIPASMSSYTFGDFTLVGSERALFKNGQRVRLGGRAMDILLTLCNRAGEIVSKENLLQTVWLGQHVDEGSLRVHISELRKVLGDGANGNRFVINVPGHGYSFVASIVTLSAEAFSTNGQTTLQQDASRTIAPPLLLTRAIGRADDVQRVKRELLRTKFISIVGHGGVGKTTLALAVTEELSQTSDHEAVFIDLGSVDGPGQVTKAFATAFGLPVRHDSDASALAATLSSKRFALIVDNCEHVVAEVAELLQALHNLNTDTLILTTSREPLYVTGERVHRLSPLSVPPEDVVSQEDIIKFSSVELFLERARALDFSFELNEKNAQSVASICRNLDGLALAIEFAASRVAVLGTDALTGYLGQQLDVLDKGRRTALPRHQKLRLTLGWSYQLLEKFEQEILRRLGVFAGSFSLEAAQAVVGTGSDVANGIADLVDKSLVTAETGHDPVRFRLLNTTREFVLEQEERPEERTALDRRHAEYYLEVLQSRIKRDPNETLTEYRSDLDNIRKSLSWSFSEPGDLDIAIPLTIAAAGFFLDLALLSDCEKWASKGLEVLPTDSVGTAVELKLASYAAFAHLFTTGNYKDVNERIQRALGLSQELNEHDSTELILSALFAFHLARGDIAEMTSVLENAKVLARNRSKEQCGLSDAMSAISLAFAGNTREALPLASRALNTLPRSRRIGFRRIGIDQRMWASNVRAQALWIEGSLEQSQVAAREAIVEVEELGLPVPQAVAYVWLIPVAIWADDYVAARARIVQLRDAALRGGLSPFRLAADGHEAVLAIHEGELNLGIEKLEDVVSKLVRLNSRMMQLAFSSNLAEAYDAAGRHRDARDKIEDALVIANAIGKRIYIPEMLRLSARFHWNEFRDLDAYAARVQVALDTARAQGSRTSELMSLTNLLETRSSTGTSDNASFQALHSLYASFDEGHEFTVLRRAREALNKYASRHSA
jgi:predicted ATPase